MTATLNAIWRFVRGIFVKKPTISFPSDFDLEESVSRLQAAIIQETFWGLLTMRIRSNRVIGKVTGRTVIIRWSRSFLENFFALYFTGRFNRNETGRVVLTGVFTMHWLHKIFMSLWIAVCVFSLAALLVTLVSQSDVRSWVLALLFIAFHLMMLCAVIGFVWNCQSGSRSTDVPRISACIRQSLSKQASLT